MTISFFEKLLKHGASVFASFLCLCCLDLDSIEVMIGIDMSWHKSNVLFGFESRCLDADIMMYIYIVTLLSKCESHLPVNVNQLCKHARG